MRHAVLVVGMHHADLLHRGEDLFDYLQRVGHVGVQRRSGHAGAGIAKRCGADFERVRHRREHDRNLRVVERAARVLGRRSSDRQHQVGPGPDDSLSLAAHLQIDPQPIPEPATLDVGGDADPVHREVLPEHDAVVAERPDEAVERLLIGRDVGDLQHLDSIRVRLFHRRRRQGLHRTTRHRRRKSGDEHDAEHTSHHLGRIESESHWTRCGHAEK